MRPWETLLKLQHQPLPSPNRNSSTKYRYNSTQKLRHRTIFRSHYRLRILESSTFFVSLPGFSVKLSARLTSRVIAVLEPTSAMLSWSTHALPTPCSTKGSPEQGFCSNRAVINLRGSCKNEKKSRNEKDRNDERKKSEMGGTRTLYNRIHVK